MRWPRSRSGFRRAHRRRRRRLLRVGSPANLYLLKFILHDWDDQRTIKILQRCREAMAPGGRIAIVEMVLGELNDPGLGALIDMNMLAASPSQERSLDEYDALLAAAGLRRTAVLATSSPQSIIVAVVAPADHGPATTCPSKSIVGLG